MQIRVSHIITALAYAVAAREAEEKQAGYYSESGLLSSWRTLLTTLIDTYKSDEMVEIR